MSFLRPIAIALVLAAQLSAGAAEVAVLRNGFAIPFVRKQQIGAKTRLFTANGFMDVATEEISSFEKEETPPTVTPVAMNVPAAPAAALESSASPEGNAASPAAAVAKVDIDAAVREASSRHQLDPDFISSVIKAESNFHPHAVSRKGAQGLMQLMPQTASKLGVTDPFDPKANIEAGTAHLSALMDMYHNDPIKALAAYNAGAHRVEQYHGVPPYRETRAYVAKIVRDFNAKKRAQMQTTVAKAAVRKGAASKTVAMNKSAVTDSPAMSNEAATAKSAPSTRTTKKKSAAPRPQQASVPRTNKPA